MFGGRKAAAANLLGISPDRLGRIPGKVGVALDELWLESVEKAEHIIDHEDLAIAAS